MIRTLYGMGENDDTMRALREVEQWAAKNDYTLSRWESHPGRWGYRATYIVHDAAIPRAARGEGQGGVIAEIRLTNREGKTSRSDAYHALRFLYNRAMLAAQRKGR